MSVTVKEFGKLENGQTAKLYTMVNKNGTEASFTDLGAAWVTMIVPDRDGKMDDVVFGYDDAETYYNNPTSCGECVGRSANRIAKGHFVLEGKEYQLAKNNGENNLHSGPDKWAKKLFTGEVTDTKLGSSVTFRLLAPDGSAAQIVQLRAVPFPDHARVQRGERGFRGNRGGKEGRQLFQWVQRIHDRFDRVPAH